MAIAGRWSASLAKQDFCRFAYRPADVRSLAIARATLAYHSGLADFAFAMQGLGSGAIRLFGTEEQKREWLPKVANGEAIAAFAHDRAGRGLRRRQHRRIGGGMRWRMAAQRREDLHLERRDRRLLRHLRTDRRGRGIARVVGLHRSGRRRGLSVEERIEVIAPHPLARLKYDDVRVAPDARSVSPAKASRSRWARSTCFG